MEEDDLYQKKRGNMIFSVYMRRRYKRDVALLAKNKDAPRNTPKDNIFGIIEKDDIHSRFILFLLKYHIHLHPRKGPRSSHWRSSTRKSVLRNFAQFTEKDLYQSLFFNKATDLRPATFLGLQLY